MPIPPIATSGIPRPGPSRRLAAAATILLLVVTLGGRAAADAPATRPADPADVERAARLRQDADARAKLDARFPDKTFDGAELTDVIDAFRDATRAAIYVNWKALD